ncbi:MAG: TerC family protein [Planctomycetaceae bacterium]|nr:TerC family protein [Planctomycetaceae bacterium]MBQ2822386.1 TerC family protein [Thermoguttaceae bacterium]
MSVVWLWIGFLALVFFMLALDLGVFNRKAHVMSIREALKWTFLWIAMALLFNVGIYFIYEHDLCGVSEMFHSGGAQCGKTAACEFLTGYLVEKSLSLDNIFVISLIFSSFGIPQIYQHRVLFWGILSALILRGLMIGLGAAMVERFDWMIYVFAALLFFTALKMIFSKHEEVHPDKNPIICLTKKIFPVSNRIMNEHFFVKIDGKWMVTPLLLALLVIETSDVIFAVDSIPAIFGITHDPFIVFTSNIFALLGLRSLYFALAAMIEKFRFLKTSLVLILLYVSLKMILAASFKEWIHTNSICGMNCGDLLTLLSLGVIIGVMGLGILASLLFPKKEKIIEETAEIQSNKN